MEHARLSSFLMSTVCNKGNNVFALSVTRNTFKSCLFKFHIVRSMAVVYNLLSLHYFVGETSFFWLSCMCSVLVNEHVASEKLHCCIWSEQKQQEAEENCIVRDIVICTSYQILEDEMDGILKR
jgi:hypothetical protein